MYLLPNFHKFILYIVGKDPDAPKIIGTQASVKADDVAVNIDERFPLINKEQPITINTVCTSLVLIQCAGVTLCHL